MIVIVVMIVMILHIRAITHSLTHSLSLSSPQAFNRGKREGFFLKSVDNAPLAKRRKLKMTSTGVETRWSSSSSSSTSSASSASVKKSKSQPSQPVAPEKS